MEFRKTEAALEKTGTRSFVVSLFSRMLQQQSPSTDIIQLINETMEVADFGHSLSPAVAVDRAVRILLVTHWARPTFSSDVSAAYKLLLQHAKSTPPPPNNVAPCHSPRNGSPGLDGSLFNFVIEKLIDLLFLNATIVAYVTGKISRRPTDAVSFPSFHSAMLACHISRDIANLSVKLYANVQDRRINSKVLTDQLRATARAMSSLGSTQTSSSGYSKLLDPAQNNASILSDCLSAFRPSRIGIAPEKVERVESAISRPGSSRPLPLETDKPQQPPLVPDSNKPPQNAQEFTINILDAFFVLY